MKNSPEIHFSNAWEIELRELIASEASKAVRQTMSQILAEQQYNSAVLLKESDIVKIYKLSRSSFRKLRNDGMPFLKIGDSVRFEKAKLDEFFAKYNK